MGWDDDHFVYRGGFPFLRPDPAEAANNGPLARLSHDSSGRYGQLAVKGQIWFSGGKMVSVYFPLECGVLQSPHHLTNLAR